MPTLAMLLQRLRLVNVAATCQASWLVTWGGVVKPLSVSPLALVLTLHNVWKMLISVMLQLLRQLVNVVRIHQISKFVTQADTAKLFQGSLGALVLMQANV